MTIPFSRLNEGSPPDADVRVVLNATPNTTPCTIGTVKVFAIKLNGVWQCASLAPGTGTGNMTGPLTSSVGELALFGNTTGTSAIRSNSLNGIPFLTSGVVSTLGSSGTGDVARISGPAITGLDATTVFGTGTIPPARIISGSIVNSRCLRTNSSGQIVVATDDCGAGGSGLADPGGNGLVKRTSLNVTTPALPGFDYLLPNGVGSALTGISFTQITGSALDTQIPNNITVDQSTLALTANVANAGDNASAFFSAGTIEAARLPDLSGLTGSVTDAQVPNNITINLAAQATLADTATLATTATTANAGDSATAFFTSGTIEVARGGTGLGAPGDDQVIVGNGTGFDFKTLPACSNGTTDKLLYNSATNTFSCGTDQTSGGGSGITTLNTLTGATQTFAKVDDTNVTLTIGSTGTTHTFTLGFTGTLADARVADNITLTNLTQITNRAIGDTSGDLAASRVDDGAAAATQALFSGAGSSAAFRAIADADIPNNITIDLATQATTAVTALAGDSATAFFPSGTVEPARLITGTISNSRCLRVNSSGQIEVHTGDCLSGGGTPGGTDTQVQFNDGGAFGGDSTFTWNKTTDVLVVNGTGLFGHTASVGRLGQSLEVTTGANYGGIAVSTYSTLAGESGILDFNRSKSATKGTQTVVASGDFLGRIVFSGSDGTGFINGAAIMATVEGTPGTNDMPGRLSFLTTPDGSSSVQYRFHITQAGHFIADTDNTYDIGASGATRPRTGYFGTSVISPLFTGDLTGTASIAATGDSATAFFSAGTIETARLGSGTANSTTFLRGDNTWATPAGSGDMVLASVQTVTGAKTFDPAKLIVGGVATLPTVVPQSFAVDSDDRKLYFGVDDTVDFWGEVYVSGLSGPISVANGGTGAATLTGLLQGNGTSAVTAITNSTTIGQVLRVTGSNTYAWGALDLADADAITSDLPFANLTQGAALSVLGVTGNATADVASIAAGTDHQVLRRSGTALAFGAVNLAQSAAVTGILPAANILATVTINRCLRVNASSVIEVHTGDCGSGGGTPGGTDTQVQFNDATAFGGDAGLTYNKTTDALTVAGVISAGGAAQGFLEMFDSDATHRARLTFNSNLTLDRIFTITTGDAARTLSMSGNITTAADFITSGANSLTLTTTGATNVTLPVSGTLVAGGAITTSGLTMATARLLGRTTAATGAVEELTVGNGLTLSAGSLIADTASETVDGVIEIATTAEINTGTDATRAVAPDQFAASNFGTRVVQMVVFDFATDTSVGDGKFYFCVPEELNGMILVGVRAQVITAGTTNATDVDLDRCATAATGNACSGTVADMLSTNITIDSGENSTDTAAVAAVIDVANDDVTTGQILRVNVDAVSVTVAKGLLVTMKFRLP